MCDVCLGCLPLLPYTMDTSSRSTPSAPHLEEACEKESEVLHKLLLLVRPLLVGIRDDDCWRDNQCQLAHEDDKERLKLGVELCAHH